MLKKHKTAEQYRADLKHTLLQHCGYIRDRYPGVKKIGLTYTLKDFDSGKEFSGNTLSWGPESLATFQLECPYSECVDGGFSLSSQITAMITAQKITDNGELLCQGWQDTERIKKHHCYCKLIYKVEIEYIR